MFEWKEQHVMLREMLQRFCAKEVVPNLRALDEETMPPYPIMRSLWQQFGIGQMLVADFEKRMARAETETGERSAKPKRIDDIAMRALPAIELSRYVPGLVTALGVSVGLTAGAIAARGSAAQKRAFVPDLLSLKKIGAWAITEPGSGSDAFGAMATTARRDGTDFLIRGQKTFITNGPYADVVYLYARYDDGSATPMHERPVISFILDGDTPGLDRGKPFRKMGMHSSPTGELFLDDVRVPADRLVGEDLDAAISGGRRAAKKTFGNERTGVAAMALGMIERCLDLCVDYANTRVQFGRPIGERQLIQLKLAKMEVARQNVENILFRGFSREASGNPPTLAEASAAKLYAAQATMEVCLEAVQLHGGYGYMADYHVEQLARDAKVLQIYGGTDEIQVSQIARDLLGRARN